LVCDPHIQIIPKLVRGVGGIVDLAAVPAKYSVGIGNVEIAYISYMFYNYAVQQAVDFIGMFRPYLILGAASGNATLKSDPNNPVAGTVPKSAVEIAHTFDAYIGSASKSWMKTGMAPDMTVNGQVIQQSLIITAALPQLIVAGTLYVILGLAALFVTYRPPGTPFTLAGILMMCSKITDLSLFSGDDNEKDGESCRRNTS